MIYLVKEKYTLSEHPPKVIAFYRLHTCTLITQSILTDFPGNPAAVQTRNIPNMIFFFLADQ